ncbi:TPA: VENN motif pre-toxin domain-containing protein, partial [Escherichia coli]|nr:VENN motif pre-toxin domain-containing protein [Escherichia coli]
MDLINPSQRRMRRSERITGKYQQAIQAATAAVQGLAGGLVGDSGGAAVAGAQSGKTTVENNALSELVLPRVQQDASLAFDLSGKGVTNDE